MIAIQSRFLEGSARFFGDDAPWSLAVDTRGAFDWRIGGDWGERAAFDGKDAFGWDWAGAQRRLEMFDLEVRAALVWAIRGAPEAESTARWSRLNARLERDRAGNPRALEYDSQSGVETWRFDGVRGPEGWSPTAVRKFVGGVELVSIVVHGSWRRRAGRVNLPPPEEPTDFSFEEGAGSRVEARKGPYGHLLVRASVGRGDPGWYILDTGASTSTLSPETARGVGLEAAGSGVVVSVLGPASAPVYRADALRVGPLTLLGPRLVELSMDGFGDAFGVPVAGVLGWDVLRRSVVGVSFQEPSIDIWRAPSEAEAVGPAIDWRPVRFNMQHPVAEGSLAGRPALLRLDIGMGGEVAAILHAGALERLGIAAALDDERVPLGSATARTGTIESLELAGTTMRPARIVVPDWEACVFRDPYVEGTIGHGILSSFRLVFDYPRARVGFLRRDPEAAAPAR